MARRTPLTSLKQISEINMTPLMDLTFLLLITFIITFPLLEQGVAVNLPVGKASPLDQKRSQSISIDASGTVYLNESVVSVEELRAAMEALAASDPTTAIMLRADKTIAYGQVMELLRLLHDAKLHRLALVTREE